MIARFSLAVITGALAAAVLAAPLLAQEEKLARPHAKVATAEAPKDSVNETVNEVALPPEDDPAHHDGVAAIVNDSVISEYDVRQRVALFHALTGVPRTPEAEKKSRAQVLDQLEVERIKFLEAQKQNIVVTASEVDKALERLRSQNNLTEDQLAQILGRTGANMSTFRQQIAVQMAWEKLVQQAYGDRINVTDETAAAELARIKRNATKPFYEVSEIFLSVDTPEQDDKVKKDIEEIASQLSAGASFAAIAQQSSQSPTAAQGGDLGWIQEGQLAPELDAALMKLHIGEVSPPIRSVGGYYLLGLRDRQEPAGTKVAAPEAVMPVDKVPLARLTLGIGSSPSKALLAQATDAANRIIEHVQGCDRLKDLVAQAHGIYYTPPGQTRYDELARDVQQKVQAAPPGGAAQPFLSPAGMEILIRCDKPAPRVTAYHIPTRDEVANRLAQEQLDVYARRYLRDLKRDAQIVMPGETLKAVRHAADIKAE